MRAPENARAGVGAVGGNGEHAAGHAVDPGGRWALSVRGEKEETRGLIELVLVETIAFAPDISVGAIGGIPPDGSAVDVIEKSSGCYSKALHDVRVGRNGAESAHIIQIYQ